MIYSVQVYFPALQGGYFTRSIKAQGPYEAVEGVVDSWSGFPVVPNELFANTSLLEIVPIHNASGIRDKSQISSMENEVILGKEIIHENGLPNCKLVLLPNEKLLLFDGHHTMLAYVASGKKLLRDIPHLVISREKIAPVSSVDIASFFPKNSQKEVLADWSKYVVNWQNSPAKQLEERQTQTIGELAATLSDRDEAASK